MAREAITIETADGHCPAHLFRPEGEGPWPGVLFFMDGIGIRPALFDMGERLASHGYLVLLPDLFYRSGPYTAPDPAKLFADQAVRDAWFTRMRSAIDHERAMRDSVAYLDTLAAVPDVATERFGVVGYCMSGGMALAAAGLFPDRIAAAASYHGGRLATDDPTSPHLLAPKIKARVYVGVATDDASCPPEMTARLEEALTAAGVDHTVETYAARHGWAPADTPAHDEAAAERHWTTMLSLFDSTLK